MGCIARLIGDATCSDDVVNANINAHHVIDVMFTLFVDVVRAPRRAIGLRGMQR